MTEIEFATYFVLEVLKAKGATIANRIQKVADEIPSFQEKGWTVADIKNEVEDFAKLYPTVIPHIYSLKEIIGQKQPPNNLMELDFFYYHNHLRDVPPATRLSFDAQGNPIRKEESFYLEMKKRFTMEDLLAYWYLQGNIQPTEHMIKQDTGKFKYLLGIYNLDEILFVIDVSKSVRASYDRPPLRNAFELERYMDQAREFIEHKKNTHVIQGINQIIRKKA